MKFANLLLPIFKDVDLVKEYINHIVKNRLPSDTSKADQYYEVHHVLPKSIFPEYEHEPMNLVKLSAYDHFVAHYILAKTKNGKMLYAFNMMSRAKGLFNDAQLDSAAVMYDEMRQAFSEQCRQDALNRPPMSEETKSKLRDFGQGKVFATNIETGEVKRIPQDEYYAHPEKYTHHMTGQTHSLETRQKMSENGIKDKVAFYHIETLTVIYEDESFSNPMYKKGNVQQSAIASERFSKMMHWTNTVTGESFRSKTCPGPEWIQKRSNFKNAFEGKSMLFDIRTGEKVLISKGEIEKHHCVHNRVLIETESKIYTEVSTVIAELGLSCNTYDFTCFLKGKKVSKKLSDALSKLDLAPYTITSPKQLMYPNKKEIV